VTRSVQVNHGDTPTRKSFGIGSHRRLQVEIYSSYKIQKLNFQRVYPWEVPRSILNSDRVVRDFAQFKRTR
jgi:hypothetical protein